MLIVMESGATDEQIEQVIDRMITLGFDVHRSTGSLYTVLGGIGQTEFEIAEFKKLGGVKEAIRISKPWRLAAREARIESTRVRIGAIEIGAPPIARLPGAGSIREVNDSADLTGAANSDAILVRNAAGLNRSLLRELGFTNKPVILERPDTASLDEWLAGADVILRGGNQQVVLCEAGVRSVTGRVLDVAAIAALRELTHLPVIAAPNRVAESIVVNEKLELAAIAAGAQGILE